MQDMAEADTVGRERTLGHVVFSLTARAAGMASTLGMAVVTARILGLHGRGLYVLPQLDASISLALFSGIGAAISHFFLRHGKGRGAARCIVISTLLMASGGAVLSALIAYAQHETWAALPSAIYTSVMAPMNGLWGYWLGTKRPRSWSLWYAIPNVASFVVVAVTLYVSPTPAAALVALITATMAVLAVGLILAIIDWRKTPADAPPWNGVAAYALRVGAVNVVSLLNYRIALFIIASASTLAVLGQYSIAVSGSEMILAIAQTIAFTITPRIGSLPKNSAAQEVARASRSLCLGMTFVCGLSIWLAPIAIGHVFGSKYAGIVPALRVLLIGTLALSSGSLLSSYFTINRGRPEIPLLSSIAATGLGTLAGVVLIPRYGMVGAATATSCAYGFGQAVQLLCFWRESGIGPLAVLLPSSEDLSEYRRFAVRSVARVRQVFA